MSNCKNAIIFGKGEAYEEIVARHKKQGYTVRACGTKVVNVAPIAAKAIFLTPKEKAGRLQFMEQNHRGKEWMKDEPPSNCPKDGKNEDPLRPKQHWALLGLEPEVAPYVDRINKNSGICTVESCWGHNGEKRAFLILRFAKDEFTALCGLVGQFISWEEVYYVHFRHTSAGCRCQFSIVWDGKRFADAAERITKVLENL